MFAAFLFVAMAGLFTPFNSVAAQDTRLLLHELVNRGELETVYTVRRSEVTRDINFFGILLQRQEFTSTSSVIGTSYGVTDNLQISAALPYIHSGKFRRDFPLLFSDAEKRDGFGDPSFLIKYGIFPERNRGIALTVGVAVKPDFSGGSKSFAAEATSIFPFIATGMDIASGVKAYADYGYVRRNHNLSDSHRIQAGLEKYFDERFTLRAGAGYDYFRRAGVTESFGRWTVEVAPYLRINKGMYLIPTILAGRQDAIDFVVPGPQIGSSRISEISLSFYYRH